MDDTILYFGPGFPFSHWYKCDFTVDDKSYCCVDQYLMYRKALLFRDAEMAAKILNSSDPRRHRSCGKKVKRFHKPTWQAVCRQYAYEANYAKFTQNESLKSALLDTLGRNLAEASPYDRNWGIGLSIANPRNKDRRNWRGRNWAGEVLEAVRTTLYQLQSGECMAKKSDLIILATARAKMGKEHALEKALRDVAAPTRVQPGSVAFSLFRSKEDPSVIIGMERWASPGDHDRHLEGDHVKKLMAAMSDVLAEPPRIVAYEILDESPS